jgi:hypothetical protein
MGIAIHDEVVTTFCHSLRALDTILDKAATHAAAHGYDTEVLLQARLAPDMFACARQFELAVDFAKGAGARLSGAEVPQWGAIEPTVAGVKARLAQCVAYLEGLDPSAFEGAESRVIEMNVPVGNLRFTGARYLMHWAIPNFYFHCTAAYAVLRHNGVPVGKLDYLGGTGQD